MGKPHDHHASKLPSSAISKLETSITLKVLIHCEGCRRKVKRIIKCVDGVESVNIEAENGKVIVSGKGVDVKDVLQNLHKAGKHAEIWQFGGGKVPHANPPNNINIINNSRPTNNINHNNNNSHNNKDSNANKMKAVGWEKLNVEDNKSLNPKGKGNAGNNFNTNFGGKMKGGEMVELSNLAPPKLLPFPNGGFTPGGHFEKPSLPSNNVAILSKSVAPMPSIYHGETSQGPLEKSEYAGTDYATHLFSDENANNCSVM